ncbi:putative tRNA-splicing endonuclease subunit [Wickerhamomyces ciferrii]|uniref:tRNA-splicing endonuclease subunit Sen2 n=1 Tax=Wickerhamomyces ciferrii (strain ATCC 14091 / BCRC 22168 / CBS 111 / JCM 3599 / NBRC 0793 / NRRL Y-1031 F-60-10) TaxID=1206466 RepID=K0KXI0_WICCF|nr:putative tRNA-splicing endonuclease subunit [Wickerhamomyces ciferrii]CCH46747.1 putative tRNA-splicing endonuclease subunit [Wickerhamomyces ciferrii]
MSKRASLGQVHKYSLPVHPIEVPNIVPHNPISWVQFLIAYWKGVTVVQTTTADFVNGQFLVSNDEDIKTLWKNGFFGKGIFSRSEATWYDRTQKRLGLGEFKNLTIEEITAIRRDERKKFKKERAKLEAKQAELKKAGIVDPFIEERLELKNLRDKDIDVKVERTIDFRDDDQQLLVDGKLQNLETLELFAAEAFFLKFALNAINIRHNDQPISTVELFNKLSSSKVDDLFIMNYVVYHHYRSLGWCVRSGIKFGTEYLLYKRGPPFHHAEHAVIILPNYKDEQQNEQVAKDFVWLSSISRVIGGVRKNLIIVFVDIPTQEEFDSCETLEEKFKLYKINELLYRRWVANKNRD